MASGMRSASNVRSWKQATRVMGSPFTAVDAMTSSNNNLVLTSCLPLAPAAACHSLTPTDKPSSEYSEQEVIRVLLTFLDGLSANVLSPDVWWLVEHAARGQLVESGNMSEETFTAIAERIQRFRKLRGQSNPMHSMF